MNNEANIFNKQIFTHHSIITICKSMDHNGSDSTSLDADSLLEEVPTNVMNSCVRVCILVLLDDHIQGCV